MCNLYPMVVLFLTPNEFSTDGLCNSLACSRMLQRIGVDSPHFTQLAQNIKKPAIGSGIKQMQRRPMACTPCLAAATNAN